MYQFSQMVQLSAFTFFLFFLIGVSVIGHIIVAYPLYKIYEKAELQNPWIAFIPGFAWIKMPNLINLSSWSILLYILIGFIPFVGPIGSVILYSWLLFQVFDNFECDTLGCLFGVFFPFFGFWYVVLTKKEYVGMIDVKYKQI